MSVSLLSFFPSEQLGSWQTLFAQTPAQPELSMHSTHLPLPSQTLPPFSAHIFPGFAADCAHRPVISHSATMHIVLGVGQSTLGSMQPCATSDGASMALGASSDVASGIGAESPALVASFEWLASIGRLASFDVPPSRGDEASGWTPLPPPPSSLELLHAAMPRRKAAARDV
jgi:hypothetical protein